MRMLLAGEWVDRDERIEVRDPADGSAVDTVPLGSADDMRAAVDAAAEGAEVARELPAHRRMAILAAAADTVAGRQEQLARTIAREGIKTIREARKEAARCVDTLRLSAEEARRLGGETIAFDQREGNEDRWGYWTREPLGVIGAVTPFNDPLNLVAHKLGPAIAAGNAVILKPDRRTPLSGLELVRALDEADVPDGVVQAVTGTATEVGDALVTDPRVAMISFTGSADVGEAIVRRAGIKRMAMELGGNCPVIVLDDADLERAVASCVSGAYWAAGQNCLHVQRILVQESAYETFRDGFVAGAEALVMGDKLAEETDMGPLIDEEAADRVQDLVQDALDAGARLLTGGGRDGTWFEPTVIEDLPDGARLATEEVYGPVTVLHRVPDLVAAIDRANAVEHGLQSAIFTASLESARHAVRGLRAGGVMVNESTDFRIDAMPFGGAKRSGIGREGVRFAVESMTEPKVVCFS